MLRTINPDCLALGHDWSDWWTESCHRCERTHLVRVCDRCEVPEDDRPGCQRPDIGSGVAA